MARWLLALVLAATFGIATPAAADTPRVTVSLTFDDGFATQAAAAQELAQHGLHGTFYLINGLVGYGDYLTWTQIKALAAAGNEIGGHTVTHPHLNQLPYAQAKAEICDNRATLLALGFAVTDFAYPYGSPSAENKLAAKACGYNSARDVSGLVDAQSGECLDCALANPVPATDPYRVRGNSSTTDSLTGVEQYVRQALDQPGTSWVPLIFHRFCTSAAACAKEKGDEYMSLSDFGALLDWLAQQPEVDVRTVQQVVGGAVQPSVGTPTAASLRAFTSPPASTGSISQAVAFRPFGLPIGQAQVLLGGAASAVLVLGVYRVAFRRRRYVG
jgi:peptidoglycan/xylan/chitin deacetylase (PgdA/CDA1 family)